MTIVPLLLALSTAAVLPASGPLELGLVRDTVGSLAAVVGREYFDPLVATQVETALRVGLAEGRYADATTLEDIAKRLTRDLFETTHDKHLAVAVVKTPPASGADPDASRETFGRRSNFGVQRVEILPGNVGYLNLTHFFRIGEAREAIAAAMRVLQSADALILDLRQNGGGSPETVALLMSYLFDTPGLPLFEIVPRSGDTTRYATESAAPLGQNGVRPVYALTARATFSAGEGAAFLLQERHRAEVIGEPTPGAANPGRPYPVNAAFSVTVPNGRVRSAVGGGNWEGGGVVPDVAASSADALRVAQQRALRQLLQTAPNGPWRDQLQGALEGLDSKP